MNRFAGLFALLVFLIPLPGRGTSPDPCDGQDAALIVDTGSRLMRLCQENTAVKHYPVSLGRGGVDKRIRGDGKTPLGVYELGPPRPSRRYKVFIPVGYPNQEQSALGFSGGDIGIHGPSRRYKWLGKNSVYVDWTLGCIAVGSDDEITEVAQWVKKRKVNKIIIQ